jgi:hypothetical protein
MQTEQTIDRTLLRKYTEIAIEDRGDHVAVRFSGLPGIGDVKAAVESLVGPEGFLHTRWLYDFRGLTQGDSSEGLDTLSAFSIRVPDPRPSRVAIVADSDFFLARAAAYQALRETDTTAVRIFRSEADAVGWLNSGD